MQQNSSKRGLSRRAFVVGTAGLAGAALAGCTNTAEQADLAAPATISPYARMYGPAPDEQFPLPAVNLNEVPEKYLRRQVDYETTETVGTVIVDTKNFYLYLVQENGKAMRYGVGIGREGFEWSGRARIAWKRAWPKWTPPNDMIARQPELEPYSAANGGMEPGLENPLGARALYIFQGTRDTLYRLHGTSEVWSIGKAVSSGCVRLLNQDIIDLYDRVPIGSRILVT
ncbi:L,D-transpeptidase [Microbaculum marinisediminis]|uniref:L,D-transpeptidase n=1 Tax=Microbaculum marinisediminis TaxID=2931392 RepID=A0AAW5QUU7_9HYPH|nr:L,D-transpeptidase [Microbaculum sp. A6E488]MCT8971856.1 L,D-transpeptidase [Microbaculum sp. A6E488]